MRTYMHVYAYAHICVPVYTYAYIILALKRPICGSVQVRKDYSGYYCVGCEAYLDEDEMSEGHICKIHQKECEWRSEENYFFRLSKYWGAVRQHLEENPDFILPTSRRSQVLVWLEEDNKRDFSISRASTSWGIPVPGDDSQV